MQAQRGGAAKITLEVVRGDEDVEVVNFRSVRVIRAAVAEFVWA